MRAGPIPKRRPPATPGSPPVTDAVEALVERFDAAVFDAGRPHARLRLQSESEALGDVLIEHGQARLVPSSSRRPDAVLSTEDDHVWVELERRGGLPLFREGRLRIRHDLHLGVGFLAATAPKEARGRLSIRPVRTRIGRISIAEAGSGPAVICLHGLGATKASFLATVGALGRSYRTIAIDLPGFGDSVKPIGAAYDPAFFAEAVLALMDALELERADLIGNSMGGRVAIEAGLRHPDRVRRLVLLAPSLAWLRSRPWAPLLRLVPTELGLIQPAPRAIVERIVKRAVPDSDDQWLAAGVDEFLRAYLTPRGRAAFYAAARNIYLEEPRGPNGFWTRLPALSPPSLFVWGHHDTLVPIGFARHVREVLPNSEHLELHGGHVPQLEHPRATHEAILRFLGASHAPAQP